MYNGRYKPKKDTEITRNYQRFTLVTQKNGIAEGVCITVLLFCMIYAETRNRTEWDGIFLVTISTAESNAASNTVQTADDTSTLSLQSWPGNVVH